MEKIWASSSGYIYTLKTFNVPTRVWGLKVKQLIRGE